MKASKRKFFKHVANPMAAQSSSEQRTNRPHPTDQLSAKCLPESRYEWLRLHHKNLFAFLEIELRGHTSTGIRIEELPFEPRTMYTQMYLEHLNKEPCYAHFFSSDQGKRTLIEQIVGEYNFTLAYERAGRKTYYVSTGLTEGLCLTVLNAPCADFRMPVPCLQLVFNNIYAREAIAFFGKKEAPEDDTVVSVFVEEDFFEKMGYRRLNIFAIEQRGIEQVSAVRRQLALKDDWTLEQALLTDWDLEEIRGPGDPPPISSVHTDADGIAHLEESTLEPFLTDGLMFVRLVLNSIRYITSHNADSVPKPWPRKFRPFMDISVEPEWTHLGETIQTVPIVVDPSAPHKAGTEHSPFAGMRYKVRFLVPGFYRRRPNTPANAPKDVWVQHHWKGPEMADVVSNVHILR